MTRNHVSLQSVMSWNEHSFTLKQILVPRQQLLHQKRLAACGGQELSSSHPLGILEKKTRREMLSEMLSEIHEAQRLVNFKMFDG
jgi:hypothetical protein